MEAVILIGLGVALCGWAFKEGKREGSRKGFWAGVRKARGMFRKRNSQQ